MGMTPEELARLNTGNAPPLGAGPVTQVTPDEETDPDDADTVEEEQARYDQYQQDKADFAEAGFVGSPSSPATTTTTQAPQITTTTIPTVGVTTVEPLTVVENSKGGYTAIWRDGREEEVATIEEVSALYGIDMNVPLRSGEMGADWLEFKGLVGEIEALGHSKENAVLKDVLIEKFDSMASSINVRDLTVEQQQELMDMELIGENALRDELRGDRGNSILNSAQSWFNFVVHQDDEKLITEGKFKGMTKGEAEDVKTYGRDQRLDEAIAQEPRGEALVSVDVRSRIGIGTVEDWLRKTGVYDDESINFITTGFAEPGHEQLSQKEQFVRMDPFQMDGYYDYNAAGQYAHFKKTGDVYSKDEYGLVSAGSTVEKSLDITNEDDLQWGIDHIQGVIGTGNKRRMVEEYGMDQQTVDGIAVNELTGVPIAGTINARLAEMNVNMDIATMDRGMLGYLFQSLAQQFPELDYLAEVQPWDSAAIGLLEGAAMTNPDIANFIAPQVASLSDIEYQMVSRDDGTFSPQQLSKANMSMIQSQMGTWGLYLQDHVRASESVRVPWEVSLAVSNLRTGGFTNAEIPAGASYMQADVDNIRRNFDRYGDWFLAGIAAIDPQGAHIAESLYQNGGLSDPNLTGVANHYAAQFLDLTTGYGYSSPTFSAMANAIGTLNPIAVTDSAAIREAQRGLWSQFLLRDPTDKELEASVRAIHSAEMSAGSGANMFRREGAYGSLGGSYDNLDDQIVFPVADASADVSYGGFLYYKEGNEHRHAGEDIHANAGSSVVAPFSGEVIGFGTQNMGKEGYIQIRGRDGALGFYGTHMMPQFTSLVKKGAWINAGEQIGWVGEGQGWGSHLHVEFNNGTFAPQSWNPQATRYDPEEFLRTASRFDSGTLQQGTISSPEMVALANSRALSYKDAQQLLRGEPFQYEGEAGRKTYERVDPNARLGESLRETGDYQRLYTSKPEDTTDTDYVNRFRQAQQSITGGFGDAGSVGVGMETNSIKTMYGHILGDTEAVNESATLKQRLFQMVQGLNQMGRR